LVLGPGLGSLVARWCSGLARGARGSSSVFYHSFQVISFEDKPKKRMARPPTTARLVSALSCFHRASRLGDRC